MRRASIVLLTAFLVSGCAVLPFDRTDTSSVTPSVIGGDDDLRLGAPPPASPSQVRMRPARDAERSGLSEVRETALREAAQTYGSQMGFARRAWEIGHRLQARASHLSEAYRFDRVVAQAPAQAGVIVPPVVSRSFDAFTSDEAGREVSVADEYLSIVSPGRIAPVVPTWRDYLLFSAPEPEMPASMLMPTRSAERDVFRKWFVQGWEAGVALADAEMDNRLARLERDFIGMLQYRRLVAQGMMDRMVLADADFGVTGEDGQMRIGSRTVRIVDDAEFQTDPLRWRVRSVGENDARIVREGSIRPLVGGSY